MGQPHRLGACSQHRGDSPVQPKSHLLGAWVGLGQIPGLSYCVTFKSLDFSEPGHLQFLES